MRPGDELEVVIPPPAPLDAVAQDIPIDIVFEDEDLVVVDKPAGLVVHPAPGHPDGTLVNALLYRCTMSGIGGVQRPGIVHRIDRDTSGLLVVAKSDLAHVHLAALFKRHDISRRYRAFVHAGRRSLAERGTFATLHGRHPKDRKRFSSKVTRGKEATTHWTVGQRWGPIAELAVRLETGRTHQIRVHFSDHGHPLLGDRVYGGRRADRRLPAPFGGLACRLSRHALHAESLGFTHPRTGAALLFESPLPQDLATLRRGLDALLDSEAPISP